MPSPFLNSLFSQDCVLCRAGTTSGQLCAACDADLPWRRGKCCSSCGVEWVLPGVGDTAPRCGACLADPPPFDGVIAAFHYAFPVDRLIQAFKFNANLALGGVFAEALREAIGTRGAGIDLVIPVPLARKRLIERGFNQSALIAESVATVLGRPCVVDGLLKVRDTPPQSGLDRAARLKNVRGAFACEESLAGKHVALVDDVMTTGATIAEAAKMLKQARAVSVVAWVVARATRDHRLATQRDAIEPTIEPTAEF